MITRHYFVLLAFLLAAHITGCASHRPAPDERATAQLVAPPVAPDSASTMLPKIGVNARILNSNTALNAQKKPILDVSTKLGMLSGIGSIFSTPAGTAHRRAVRLVRAAGPRRLGKGAVYAPKATEVVSAYKPRAAVINADTGAIVTAIGKNKASAATAPGAVATTTTLKPGFPWGRVALALGGVGLLVLLLATPVVPWLLAAFKHNRNTNNQA